MASKNEAKVKFSADTKDFTAAIKQANSTLTTLRSELKLNKTEAQGAGDSIDNLAQRQRILGDELQASQSKVAALTNKLEAARSAFGDGSIEVQKLETQLNNARTAQTKMQQELDQTNSALSEMESASAQASTALGKLENEISGQESELASLKAQYNNVAAEMGKNSDEARSLASQIKKTSKELSDNKSSFDKANSAADKFDKTLGQVGDTAKDTGGDLGAMDVALGDFISDTAQNAISTLSELEESTRQYRNEQNKLEAVSKNSGTNLDDLKAAYADLYAITGDETLASTATLNMSAMGISVKDQETIVNAAAGAWAAYGDSIPLDGLLESINETARASTVTGSFADALNWANMTNEQWSSALAGNSKAQKAFNKGIADGMTVEDAFNEALAKCTTTQERQELITSAMDAAYGKLGGTYQETNADVISANDATRELSDAQASLSEAVAPAATALTNLQADGLQWLADNLPVVVPVVTGLGVAAGGLWLALGGGTAILTAVTGGFTALSAAMLANPIGVIVALIAGLVAAFVLLWNNCEGFRNFWIGLWEGAIKPAVDAVVQWFTGTALPAIQGFIDGIVGFFTGLATTAQGVWDTICNAVQVGIMFLGEIINLGIQILLIPWNFIWENFGGTITTIWTSIQTFVGNAINTVSTVIQTVLSVIQSVWSSIWGAISGVASAVWGTISGVVSSYIGAVQGVISSVLGVISGVWSSVWGTVSGTASSIWNTITSTISNAINSAKSTISSVINSIKSTFSSGFNAAKSTVSSVFNSIKSTISNTINGAKNTVKSAIDRIKGFFNFSWSLPKLKLPHISISGSFSLTPPSVPKFGISWYAEGGILNAPTIFGAMGNSLLGGGEAGPEAVLPIEKLRGYIEDVMDSRNDGRAIEALADSIEALADRVISIEVNGRELARATASDTDRVNGSRQKLHRRGVSLA